MSVSGAYPLLSIRRHGNALVIVLRGAIDAANAPEIEFHLDCFTAIGPALLLIDLRPVTFIGSCGIRLLARAHERLLAHGGSLSLICVRPFVLRLFAVPGLCPCFTILDRLPDPTFAA
ncbi:STAS domain-containing protein [Embleya sp. NPDC055664]